MTAPLTILLIDNSAVTSVRLVELLQNTKEVHKVFYAKDIWKGCAMFSVDTIDVLILANYVINDDLARISELCKSSGCEIILLCEYTDSGYRSWCKSIGISNLASEIRQVEIALKKLVEQ
jgi:hypothetical protein